jgi:FtsH-binding integral membrane protein
MAGRRKQNRADTLIGGLYLDIGGTIRGGLKIAALPCITLAAFVIDQAPNPTKTRKSRGWALVAAGFLLMALALVVVYTTRRAFLSPLALVVVAAIGLAALLLQLRLRKDLTSGVHAPLWVNVLGLIFALAAVCADFVHLGSNFMALAALGAVVCFSISGAWVLRSLRKEKI